MSLLVLFTTKKTFYHYTVSEYFFCFFCFVLFGQAHQTRGTYPFTMSWKTFSLGQEQIRFRQGKFVDGPAANLAINVFVESVYEEMQLMVVISQV